MKFTAREKKPESDKQWVSCDLIDCHKVEELSSIIIIPEDMPYFCEDHKQYIGMTKHEASMVHMLGSIAWNLAIIARNVQEL